VILTSAATGEGIEGLNRILRGRVSVLVGKSGVGKSSVLNAVQPGLGLSIQEVSQKSGKGRHTTTQMQMFPLSNSGAVIDTPGIREFGLWNVEDQDLADYFPEMRPLIGRCRFASSCAHNEEPGCAVRQAVVSGQIDPYRYQSYLRLLEEVR
jgi:ribosome biogenesis GTPase